MYNNLDAPLKTYLTIPKAKHFFGVLAYTKINDSHITQQLVYLIDQWIKKH